MKFTVSEVLMLGRQTGVTLWRVKGLHDQLFPTEIVAQVAARQAFPSETADVRYARISFSRFVEDV